MTSDGVLTECYRAANSLEAQLVCNHLCESGIEARIQFEMVEANSGWLLRRTTPIVCVRCTQLDIARKLVIALDRKLRSPERSPPIQFGLRGLVVCQLGIAVLLAVYTAFRPSFYASYVGLSAITWGSLMAAAWRKTRKRRRVADGSS